MCARTRVRSERTCSRQTYCCFRRCTVERTRGRSVHFCHDVSRRLVGAERRRRHPPPAARRSPSGSAVLPAAALRIANSTGAGVLAQPRNRPVRFVAAAMAVLDRGSDQNRSRNIVPASAVRKSATTSRVASLDQILSSPPAPDGRRRRARRDRTPAACSPSADRPRAAGGPERS